MANKKIYVSSSQRDSDLAHDLAIRLDKAGLKVTTPLGNIDAGDNIKNKIIEELRKADEIVVILTKNSVDSKWLLFEMGYATSLGKHLTPLIQGIEPEELPEIIKQMEYVKYSDLDKYISTLQQRTEEPTKSAA
jgi:nucleoside 2-deoxyribosyltransferase